MNGGLVVTDPTGDGSGIDVRTPAEYAEGHVPGAINIPHDEIAAEIGSLDLVKSQSIYLYCGSGRRAGIAKESLEVQGYSQVKNLGGLQDALKEAGAEPAR